MLFIVHCTLFLFVFWLRNRPSINTYAAWGMEGVIKNMYRCVQKERGITPHVKDVFVRNGYFSPMRSISVVMK